MEAYLDWQKKSGGIKLNDVIEEYRYVAAGKIVKKGDFLTYVGEDVAPATETPVNAIALSDGVGGTDAEHNEQVKIARVYKEIIHTDNIFATTWESVTNGYKYKSSDGYVLETSSCADSANYPANYACDSSTSTSWRGESRSQDWLKLTLPQPVRITKMKTYITLSSSSNFGEAIIQGSNNDSEWDNLYVLSTPQTGLEEIELQNNNEYQYYRILIKDLSGYTPIVFEWQTSEYVEGIQ
jgi:hypothetical protein